MIRRVLFMLNANYDLATLLVKTAQKHGWDVVMHSPVITEGLSKTSVRLDIPLLIKPNISYLDEEDMESFVGITDDNFCIILNGKIIEEKSPHDTLDFEANFQFAEESIELMNVAYNSAYKI